jgi:hypothetical protein
MAASWIRRGQRPVVSDEVIAMDQLELQAEVIALQRSLKFLLAIIRLTFLLVRLSGFRLDSQRVPGAATKRSISDAVAHATKAIPLAVALRVLRLSADRYHEWSNRPKDCSLDESPNCSAYAERFVKSIKYECLNHFVFFGERDLRHVIKEYVAHYHSERFHQGLSGQLIVKDAYPVNDNGAAGKVRCRARLGGMRNFYVRDVA